MNPLPSPGTELFRSLRPEKQEKVFQAALHEFAMNGYRNASMNSVVKAAGISKGSLFQYFRTKQALFDGVVEIAAGRVKIYLKQVRDETERENFFERLEQLLYAGFSFIDRHHLLARIYFQLLQSGETPSGSERVAFLRRQGVEFLADFIRVAMARGEVRGSVDVERTAFLINALLETLLRAYYTEFMASGLGLYRGNADELADWVRTALDVIREGVQGNESE